MSVPVSRPHGSVARSVRPDVKRWTVMGHIDATAPDLEHFELQRVDDLELYDRRDSNVVLEVRRNPTPVPMKRLADAALASCAPFVGLVFGAAALTAPTPLVGLALLAVGAAEMALLLPVSKKALEDFKTVGFTSSEPHWKGTRRFEIQDDLWKGINSPMLAASKSSRVPSGAQLGTFLTDTMNAYPAERYAMVLAGHGRAMDGVGGLSVKEMAHATEIAHARGGRKVDVLVLDSCLVGNVETLLPMADHVRYAVVSQETLYTHVVDWGAIIKDQNGSQPSAERFTRSALDIAERKAHHQTLSTIDMTAMPALRTTLENLGDALRTSARQGHRGEIREAFASAPIANREDFFDQTFDKKIDLGQTLRLLSQVPDPSVKQAAQTARDVYDQVVIDHRRAPGFGHTTGLTIQGPRAWHSVNAYARESGLPSWSKALGEMRPWPVRMLSNASNGVKRLFS